MQRVISVLLVALGVSPGVTAEDSAEKKKKLITIEMKKEIFEKREKGVRIVDRTRQYSRTTRQAAPSFFQT